MKHHSLFLWAVAGLAFTLHPVQAEEHDWTNKEGQTILLVEENVSRAINFSDHIYLLDEGQITWNGSGDELSKNDRLMEVYLGM